MSEWCCLNFGSPIQDLLIDIEDESHHQYYCRYQHTFSLFIAEYILECALLSMGGHFWFTVYKVVFLIKSVEL